MRFAGQALGGGFADLGGQMGTTDFGEMTRNSLDSRSKEKQMATEAESVVNQYGMKSMADMKAAEFGAEATRAQGQAAGQSAMFGGLMDGISGIAGAGIQKFGGAGAGTPAVPRTSPGVGIPGSVGTNGKPMYGPAW